MIDFNHMPDEAILRQKDFLRCNGGPVPCGKTRWNEMVASGEAPPPDVRRGRLTGWFWGTIRAHLESLGESAERAK